ncbi:MAG: prepilin-type N-terminal cleavage/methylation domain-containing protein [Akkermansia sp.]|nr:prepilin-type N-terminal cleavage/methylation domain-containing protein [Akkermansia sp.]
MKTTTFKKRRGFTLVELIVAMAITAGLVLIIMQLTNKGVDLWKKVQEDVSTSTSGRVALQIMARDLESFQMKGNNRYEWLFAKTEQDRQGGKLPKGLKIPRSVQLVFFSCAPDRNPAVSSSTSLRSNYRGARAHNMETQGDVNAIGYRLMYRDQVLNVDANDKERGIFPIFSLYRQLIPPRESFEKLMCQERLDQAYVPYEKDEKDNFLCENIVELSLIFNIEYVRDDADAESGRVAYDSVSIPVISSSGTVSNKSISVFGDRIVAGTTTYRNARVVSATMSITVLTDEGVNLVEQVRQKRRRAPKPEEFFRAYTRAFTSTVLMPQPM